MVKKGKHIALLLTSLLVSLLCRPQQPIPVSTDGVLENIIEAYAPEDEEEIEILYDELERLINNPVNLNTATKNDLENIFFLNRQQINNLLQYRDKSEQIYSIYELQAVDGFDRETIENLGYFVSLSHVETETKEYFKHRLNIGSAYTFEKAEGFIKDENGNKDFEGITPKLYLKYKGEKGTRFSWGLVAENDPGESFFSGANPYGFDFYSGYVGYSGKKTLQNITLGSFRISSGQGLIFGSAYGGRKSVEAMSIRMTGTGIRTSLSASEYSRLMGAATHLSFNNFDIMAFYSNTNADANIADTTENGEPLIVTSLQTAGLHRTGSEIADKNALNTQLAGIHTTYNGKHFTVGITGGYNKLSSPLEPTESMYNRFYFRGTDNANLGTDFFVYLNKLTLFGEAAISSSGGMAAVAGSEIMPNSQTTLRLLYRNFAKDFHTLNGNSFSEWSGNMNEEGLFTGITLLPLPGIRLNAYFDLYRSHYRKYTSNKPVTGTDFSVQCNYIPSREIDMYLRIKSERRNENSSGPEMLRADQTISSNRVRYNMDYTPVEWLKIRFRAEWSGYNKGDSLSQGWFIMSDLGYRSPNEKISITGRFAWFKTGDYNSRIYAYENDVPSSFYIPAFYMNGLRYYLNSRVKITPNISVWLKIARTFYFNREEIGTGDMAIDANHKTDVKLHLRFRF
jgi:hypothetical protein